MKYANRYGDGRSIFYRKGDNIEMDGKYYTIADVIDVPSLYLDFGTVNAGTTSDKKKAEGLDPREDGKLVHTLVGVVPFKVGFTSPEVAVDYVEDVSCLIRMYRPKEQPQWVSPYGTERGWIDVKTSPEDDPNELFPVFTTNNNPPYFEAENTYGFNISQKIKFFSKIYVIKELTEKPATYAPIPYTPKYSEA